MIENHGNTPTKPFFSLRWSSPNPSLDESHSSTKVSFAAHHNTTASA